MLIREGKPFYVGISGTLIQRLRQHVTGKTHFDASLAYLMATDKTGHTMKRADAMKDAAFMQAFNEAQALLQKEIAALPSLKSTTPSNFICLKPTVRWNWTHANGTHFERIER